MTWQTQLLLIHRFELSALSAFVFLSTMLLYSVHRLVSFTKLSQAQLQGRFASILPYRAFLQILVFPLAIAAGILFFQFPVPLQIALFIPILLAAGYALPILPKGKRLRDFGLFKNVLIAGVWTWVTLLLPVLEMRMPISTGILLLFLGRFCFIFALSLPFDIRDVALDQEANVHTIPVSIGIPNTKKLAVLLNILTFCCAGLNFFLHYLPFKFWIGIGISTFIASFFITLSSPRKNDYYFAGLLDGIMILQFLILLIVDSR